MLNDPIDGFISKIGFFYKNFPKGCTLQVNKARQWELDELSKLSPVLIANGKTFTDEFFENMGLSKDYFEDAALPLAPTFDEPKPEETTKETQKSRLVLATEQKEKFNIKELLKKKVQ